MPTEGEPLSVDEKLAALRIRLAYLEDHRGHDLQVERLRRQIHALTVPSPRQPKD